MSFGNKTIQSGKQIAVSDGFMLFKDWQYMVKNRRSYTFGNEKDPDYQKRFDAIVEWRALRLYNTPPL